MRGAQRAESGTLAGRIDGSPAGAPPRRAGIVDRPRPVKALLDADGPLAVVVAPAGYGKTTAVAQWAEVDPRPAVWVGLTRVDDDPVELLDHVAAAAAAVGPVPSEVRDLLRQPGRSPDLEAAPALGALLGSFDPFVLVLDDVHLLRSRPALRCLEVLVDGVPQGGTVALVGRSTGRFPLARRRLYGGLVEVGVDDLAMSVDEARQLFDATGTPVAEPTAAALRERTEGWPIGLYLAALHLDGDEVDADRLVSGRTRLLADFLVDEVLDGLPARTTRFLERSAVLERMSAPLLDRLLESSDAGGQLEALERSGNLFLVPLDDSRTWYRYHHLFRELLEARLWARDADEARALHRRAGEVLADAGDLDGAIHHAIAAGDLDDAAERILDHAAPAVLHGRTAVVRRWLDELGDDVVGASGPAALAAAWVALGDGDGPAIVRWLDVAGSLIAEPAEGAPLDGQRCALEAFLALIDAGGHQASGRRVDLVIEQADPTSLWWGIAVALRGILAYLAGDRRTAAADLQRALPRLEAIPAFHAAVLGYLAVLAFDGGDRARGEVLAAEAVGEADAHDLRALPGASLAYVFGSLVAARTGRAAEARRDALTAEALLLRAGLASPRLALVGHACLARTALALDDLPGVRRHLAVARRAQALEPDVVHVNAELDAVQAALAAAERALPGRPALTAAELRLLPLLPTHLSLQEIAERLYLSRNTVKSHSMAVYRKLGARSRSEAVAIAVDLGLLEGPATGAGADHLIPSG